VNSHTLSPAICNKDLAHRSGPPEGRCIHFCSHFRSRPIVRALGITRTSLVAQARRRRSSAAPPSDFGTGTNGSIAPTDDDRAAPSITKLRTGRSFGRQSRPRFSRQPDPTPCFKSLLAAFRSAPLATGLGPRLSPLRHHDGRSRGSVWLPRPPPDQLEARPAGPPSWRR
jgi:hypothetical protein